MPKNQLVQINRRLFLGTSAAAISAGLMPAARTLSADEVTPGALHLATFRFDVTPPMGHSLCGGWIRPVEVVDDPLEAIGYVLLQDTRTERCADGHSEL